MVQSFMGFTSYDGQSLENILIDVNNWYEYSLKINTFFKTTTAELKANDYFNTIGFNFKLTIEDTILTTDSFLHDFKIIKTGLENKQVSDSIIRLLKNIGDVSYANYSSFGKDYKDDTSWFDYDNKDFRKAESLYAKGKDFFFTLMDASSAGARLEDYKTMENNTQINNINGNNNFVQTGANSTMNNSFGNDIQKATDEKLKKLLENIDSYFTAEDSQKKEEAIEYIEFISDEVKKDTPKKGMLEKSLAGLKVLNNSASFLSTVVSIATTLGFSI